MAATTEFQVVKSRKSKKFRQEKKQNSCNSQSVDISDHVDLPTFKKRLNSCIQDLLLSEFFSETVEIINSALSTISNKKSGNTNTETGSVSGDQENLPQLHKESESTNQDSSSLNSESQTKLQFLSYGIGHFTSCPIARYQFAFFLALRDKFEERCSSCCVFDPVFSKTEKAVLETYNCEVIQENEEGKRICTSPTVAFLPHCGKALYNNLLWRNLATSNLTGLRHLVLIGNSFNHIIESNPQRILQKTGNYILKLHPYTSQVQLPNSFTHKDVFNDLAVHTFLHFEQGPDLEMLEGDLEEPVYDEDDVEFIVK